MLYSAVQQSDSVMHVYIDTFFFNFPTLQQGIQVIYITFFPPPFVLLQHEYLDIVLNAIQQDLLVNLF